MLLYLTEGQVSDHKLASEQLPHLPNAAALIAGRGYGSNCFRDELAARDFVPCIPGQKNRQQDVDYDKTLHKQRPKIENMFATPKDWRRIATR